MAATLPFGVRSGNFDERWSTPSSPFSLDRGLSSADRGGQYTTIVSANISAVHPRLGSRGDITAWLKAYVGKVQPLQDLIAQQLRSALNPIDDAKFPELHNVDAVSTRARGLAAHVRSGIGRILGMPAKIAHTVAEARRNIAQRLQSPAVHTSLRKISTAAAALTLGFVSFATFLEHTYENPEEAPVIQPDRVDVVANMPMRSSIAVEAKPRLAPATELAGSAVYVVPHLFRAVQAHAHSRAAHNTFDYRYPAHYSHTARADFYRSNPKLRDALRHVHGDLRVTMAAQPGTRQLVVSQIVDSHNHVLLATPVVLAPKL